MAVFVFVRLKKTKVSYHVDADNLEQAVKLFNDDGGLVMIDESHDVLEQWVYDGDDNDVTHKANKFEEAYWEVQTPSLEAVLERQAAEKDTSFGGKGGVS